MPIYEYRCENCEHELEAIQKMSDAPLTDCPSCGQPKLVKKISAAAFRLKGSGWYETDFKTSDRKKNLAQQESKPGDGKAADNKTDNKTDNKKGAKDNAKANSKSADKGSPSGASSGASAG
jgi:putative FmdB family regulatory protein